MKKKFPLIIKIVLLLAIGFLLSVIVWWRWAIQAPSSEIGQEKTFIITKGESTASIAQRLYQEKLIRSPWAFKIILYKEMLIGKIQAGSFRLSPSLTPRETGEILTHGTEDTWVTILEGWRSEEIIQALNEELSQDFTKDIDKFIENEGYLFPDTYLFPKEADSDLIIKKLKENFYQKFSPQLREEAEKKNLSMEEVIVLASLIEREAKHHEDHPIVANILIKRWRANWVLQVDATVQCVKANDQRPLVRPTGGTTNDQINWWPKVTKEDLNIDSLYNTYKYPGLPPGPICNPGLVSLEAVVNYQETPYWYYLSDNQGNMHYATTIAEHNQNIAKYLQ